MLSECNVRNGGIALGHFRSDYKCNTKYKYDFLNQVSALQIITCNTIIVLESSFSAGQQQKGVRALET